MTPKTDSYSEPERSKQNLQPESGRRKPSLGAWTQVLAGASPFLLFGLATAVRPLSFYIPALRTLGPSTDLLLAVFALTLVGLGLGWVRGFPRWSYPHVSLALTLPLYFAGMPTYDLKFLFERARYGELLGWRAWIPAIAVLAVALLLTRSLRPLWNLASGIWHDWTRLSFGLYGLLPFLFWAFGDETSSLAKLVIAAASTVFLTAGALTFMLARDTRERTLCLLGGLAIGMMVTVLTTSIYWDGRVEPWMRAPPERWYVATARGALAIGLFMALLVSPAVLGLARNYTKPFHPT